MGCARLGTLVVIQRRGLWGQGEAVWERKGGGGGLKAGWVRGR